MILIFTTSHDLATTLVCNRLNKNFHRINSDIDEIEVVIDINNGRKCINIILNKDEIVNLEDITAIWYRRGFGITDNYIKNTDYIFSSYFHQNMVTINNFFSEFTSDRTLGSYIHEMNVNKLTNLHLASETGMLIPPCIVTSCKNEVKKFSSTHGKTIIKPVKNPFFFEHEGEIVTPSSGILLLNDDMELPDKFSLSMFQKYIEKKFELRIFFLYDAYYAFAIFSQIHEDSKMDYRDGNPYLTRSVPYVLPNVFLKKLKSFRKKTNLTTGSIDIIVDQKLDFYFLEVNPSGQFLSLSQNCNAYLEKSIAECLSY